MTQVIIIRFIYLIILRMIVTTTFTIKLDKETIEFYKQFARENNIINIQTKRIASISYIARMILIDFKEENELNDELQRGSK